MKHISLLLSLFFLATSVAQTQENRLEQLSFYIGTWGLPSDGLMMQKNPKMKDYKVIDLEWGAHKKVIVSRTGIYNENGEEIHSEGIITFNPNNNKLVWLEYQIENEILFEGEYVYIENNQVQRIYTVHYPAGYKTILYPELEGWTRKFRETFTPTSENTIDWLTEVLIDGKWRKHRPDREDAKAIRDHESK
ncbi:MAG: hypothetical protein QNJ57_10820 [Flavobacteriaceae bacterium]|nr:hypothetical protein [Flavobacteriaceae bacterium]